MTKNPARVVPLVPAPMDHDGWHAEANRLYAALTDGASLPDDAAYADLEAYRHHGVTPLTTALGYAEEQD